MFNKHTGQISIRNRTQTSRSDATFDDNIISPIWKGKIKHIRLCLPFDPLSTGCPSPRWHLPATALKAATLCLLPAVCPRIPHSCFRGRVCFYRKAQLRRARPPTAICYCISTNYSYRWEQKWAEEDTCSLNALSKLRMHIVVWGKSIWYYWNNLYHILYHLTAML